MFIYVYIHKCNLIIIGMGDNDGRWVIMLVMSGVDDNDDGLVFKTMFTARCNHTLYRYSEPCFFTWS